jgi:outer membrane autotransporter protein
LTGSYQYRSFLLEPSARIYALWERDSAYTDTLGVAQTANNFSTGRASAGSKLSYPMAWSPTIALAPYAGVYGDYYFASSTASIANIRTPALLLQGWSARFATGVSMQFKGGGMISAGGELGGIGSGTNTNVYTYRVRGSLPF